MNTPPSDLRFLAALGLEMGANLNELIMEFEEVLGDGGDDDTAIRGKITRIKARLRAWIGPSPGNNQALSPRQDRIRFWFRVLSGIQGRIA
jgi:hypothetical protein